jgi:GNAT superfamily N-acetyltransferase
MKESFNIIQANIDNLTSLWQKAAGLNACFLSDDFNYCYIENYDWPNRLWFEKDITKNNVSNVRNKLFSTLKYLTIPYWNIYDSTSYNKILEDAEFKEKSVQIGMSLELKERPQKQLRLNFERVICASQAKLWANVYPKAFGYRISEEIAEKLQDGIEFYLAFHQEEPVGTAIVYQTANIVGIHGVGVASDQRRQGFAEEIMEFVLNRAVTLGGSHATLQASVMGKGLYDKLGFKENFTIKNYVLNQDS